LLGPLGPAQATTLKIATLAPDGTSWMRAARSAADEIAERTAGRLQLRFYPGGVMGNDRSVLRKMRVGQLQGGMVTSGGLSDVYPDIQIYGLPFAFRSHAEVDYVRARMDPLLIENLAAAGLVSFGLSEGGFAYLASREPIRSVADLRLRKVWTPEGDAISMAAFRAIEVSPIPLPLSDVLTGLQTGLIDTIAGTPAGIIALQWHTQVGDLTDAPLLYTYGTLVIDERALRKVSAADRTVLAEVLSATLRQVNTQSREADAQALQALRDQGIQIITPPEAELERWRAPVNQAIDDLAAEGVISEAMLDLLRQHLRDVRSGRD
jgi:TRAP-type C4-dicarboxylate transport system substrate-binding protein